MTDKWTPAKIPSQAGKRVIVTGGNSGIGWHTALELARAGAEVTIASRSQTKGENAVRRIADIVPNANIQVGVLDLSVPSSIEQFAAEFSGPLDMLINNAGIMGLPKREVSIDGHELQFATNVLGPYRLTGLLLGKLLQSQHPRVVTVSSGTHKMIRTVPLSDLEALQSYNPMRVYARTKLANILFARELQRRAGSRLLSTIAHPGAAKTNLFGPTVLSTKIAAILIYPLLQTADMGSWPTLLAATSETAKPGGYYGPGGFLGLRGNPVEDKTSAAASNVAAGEQLFADLQLITGLRYDL